MGRGWEWEAGMLPVGWTTPALGVVAGNTGRVWLRMDSDTDDDPADYIDEIDSYYGWRPADRETPELHDPLTRAALRAQLARRVGLDPSGGVLWYREGAEWVLRTADGEGRYLCELRDPHRALLMALEET